MVSKRKRFIISWRRAGMGLRVFFFLLAASLFSLLIYVQRPQQGEVTLGNNLLVFLLVNLNVVVLLILAFLIGRNIVKLIFDRRRKILGSHLRMRLLLAFVGLTLVPTVILFVLASGLLTQAMEGWFSSHVEASVDGAMNIARHHYVEIETRVKRIGFHIARRVEQEKVVGKTDRELRDFLSAQRSGWGLFSIRLLRSGGGPVLVVQTPAAEVDDFKEPDPDSAAIQRGLEGESSAFLEEREARQFVRVYQPVDFPEEKLVLVATRLVKPELSLELHRVNDSFKEYEQLKFLKSPIKSGYRLTLTMITGLILFSAIWIAFYISRELVGPIEKLARGMSQVARGNLGVRVRAVGDDEIGFLVRSFNSMTTDLKQARDEGERRRRYIETILGNLAVGVISIDRERKTTLLNPAAIELFGLDTEKEHEFSGKDLTEVLSAQDFDQVVPLLERMEGQGRRGEERSGPVEIEFSTVKDGRERSMLCTAGPLFDEQSEWMGSVLIFDDITELNRAQQMAAWREVARRIAHEIKNPLTPIQLAAQRLRKRASSNQEDQVILESTQTIIDNVDSIKRLANEFSHFARMPTAEFTLCDLNVLITDTIGPFAENHPDIVFKFIPDKRVPDISMDREQLRRVLINLIDNSIGAFEEAQLRNGETPRITVQTSYDRKRKTACLEVTDNGPGIPDAQKSRIFQPYFTTKARGTGLGLAIVTTIVSDHHGEIKVYDNDPAGTKFIVELPLAQREATKRRYAV